MPCWARGAKATVEAGVDLLLHEGFRYREVEAGDPVADHLVLGLVLEGRGLAVKGHLAELGFEGVPGLEVAELRGEFIVALGEGLALDRLDGYVVADGLAGEFSFAEVGGVGDFEAHLLAGPGAAQSVVEGGQRVFAADLDKNVVAANGFGGRGVLDAIFGYGLGEVLDLSLEFDLGPIAIGESAVFFDRLDDGVAFEDAVELGLKLVGC